MSGVGGGLRAESARVRKRVVCDVPPYFQVVTNARAERAKSQSASRCSPYRE